MSAPGRGAPASRKRPRVLLLGAAAASASASCGEAEAPGSPRAKRRLFAADDADRLTAAAAAAENDRRRLIIRGAATAALAAAFCCVVIVRRKMARKYNRAQLLAPLCDALKGLASAISSAATTGPHPDLYRTVMGVPGFTEEQLITALFYLVEGSGRGAAFLIMSEPHRALWIKQILAKQ
ncbi:hypothetical protein ACP4OV_014936 [Aristida adscensionis]